MPSIYAFKTGFQRLLRPPVRLLAKAGITANQVTLLACALSIAIGLYVTVQIQNRAVLLLLPIFLPLRMALNAMDGMLAREYGQKSHLGAYLNELTDVLSDAFLYLPFAFAGFDPLWIGADIVLAVTSEMAGTVAVMTGAGRRYDGPMGKSDRAFVFGAIALWIGLGGNVVPWAWWLLPRVIALLLIATIVNRVRGGLAETASYAKR